MTAPGADALIVMTRLPQEGRNKTRLIPALGEAGATAMHDRLARHSIGRAAAYTRTAADTRLEIHLAGGSPAAGREWLGEVECHAQSGGDLGHRMQAATNRAFANGARRVVVIGTDCPSIDEARLKEAYQALQDADLVFGPAADGGYYLVGLSSPCPAVFRGIDWGTDQVLDQSLKAAANAGCSAHTLPSLSDVDLAEDLPAAELHLNQGERVSVVIPTFNEEATLQTLLERLKLDPPHEIIVADGGSTDGTRRVAEHAGATVVNAQAGRARQMNAGAAQASGEHLLFLHADTLPPANYQQVIRENLQKPHISFGAFRFELSGELPASIIIEAMVQLRCRICSTPYGDQGLFMRRSLFNHLGGFPEWPVLEDLHMVRGLKRLGKLHLASESALTSPRRWQESGTLRTWWRHQRMLAAYYLGMPPERIATMRS